jgi:phage recombination protein Bet
MADQLPALRASRLPWHPVMEEYGVQKTDWQALVEAVFPGAQTLDSIRLALSYCKRRNLDPFKKVIHIVPVWDSEQRKYVDTIWPGIAELRTTAFRTQQYAGADPTEFGAIVEQTWQQDANRAIKIIYPAWAQLTVYRLVGGQRVPVPGPRVYWIETYSAAGRSDVPNARWQRAPFQMLEKCAEAAALRRAFPEELGDEHAHEEAGAYTRDVTPPSPDVDEPKAPRTTGNRALRDKLARRLSPEEAPAQAGEPTEQEIERSQTMLEPFAQTSGVLGADQIAKLDPAPPPDSPPPSRGRPREEAPAQAGDGDDVSPSPTPEGDTTIPMILPARKHRSWDWPGYAAELIEAAHRLPPDQIGQFRVINASQMNNLRVALSEEWSRVQQALAEHEREGA